MKGPVIIDLRLMRTVQVRQIRKIRMDLHNHLVADRIFAHGFANAEFHCEIYR